MNTDEILPKKYDIEADNEENQIHVELVGSNRCASCGAWEHKPHPLRGVIVRLELVTVKDKEARFCQICTIRNKLDQSMRKKSSESKLLRYFFPKF